MIGEGHDITSEDIKIAESEYFMCNRCKIIVYNNIGNCEDYTISTRNFELFSDIDVLRKYSCDEIIMMSIL
jgi:hypothetical protein